MQFRSTRPLPNTTAIAADWYRRPNVTGFSLLTSLFAHILIILGIGFVALSSTPDHIQPIILDFTLVNTADTPLKHNNVLAQHNQRGGGDASPMARTVPFQFSLQRPSLDVQRYQRGFLPNSSRRQGEVVMVNEEKTETGRCGPLVRHLRPRAGYAVPARWCVPVGYLLYSPE
jgi:hypothetical protein